MCGRVFGHAVRYWCDFINAEIPELDFGCVRVGE